MATKPPDKPPEDEVEPTVLEEPRAQSAPGAEANVWLRGLWMLLFAAFIRVAEAILFLAAVLQFLWLLFGKEKNANIAAFGDDLADWMARAARYQACATDERPFPFAKWGKRE